MWPASCGYLTITECHQIPPQLDALIQTAKGFGISERLIIAGELAESVIRATIAQRVIFAGATESGVQNFDNLRCAIGVCIASKCAIPALLLIYAGIDIAGALYAPTDQYRATGEKFKAWATRFMLPKLGTTVTADELWAARCGVVHVYGPNSGRPSAQASSPRELSYVTFTAEKQDWHKTMQTLQAANAGRPVAPNAVVLSIQEIAAAFDQGWKAMLAEVHADPKQLRVFEAHCAEQFEFLSLPKL